MIGKCWLTDHVQLVGRAVCVCAFWSLCVCVPQEVRVYNEEVELEGRDPQQDYMLYKDTCDALSKLMAEIQELKAGGAKDGVSFTFAMCPSRTMVLNGTDLLLYAS